MVAKTMDQQKFCESCDQKHDCKEVYRQLGKKESPPVTFKVITAFLIPILVFIAVLIASEKISAGMIETKELRIILNFLLAVAVTLAVALIIRAIYKSGDRSRETE
ncbi:MAG: hypothetical protein ACYSSO_02530 [Planctomycetota bacterium]|jgi:uncharacterized membrane-anchored protein